MDGFETDLLTNLFLHISVVVTHSIVVEVQCNWLMLDTKWSAAREADWVYRIKL